MKLAIVIAVGLLIVTAVVGTAVALGGATEVGLIIGIAGGIASAGVVFLAPWLIHFSSSEDPGAR